MAGEVCPDARNITSILIDTGTVTEAQVEAGLKRQRETGTRIGEALVELGAATEEDIGWALARQLGIPFVDLSPATLDQELIRAFSSAVLHRLMAVPLVRAEKMLSVAFGDPTDREAIAEIGQIAGLPIRPSAAAPSAIREVLDELGEPHAPSRPSATPSRPASSLEHDRSGTRALQEHIERALAAGASELHFIPDSGALGVYHRVGDRIARSGSEPSTLLYYLLARIEALGGPVIDGDDVHAAGRLVCPLGDHEVVLDVSLLGCEGGAAITLTVRTEAAHPLALELLGLDPVDVARLRSLLDTPAGLIVVAGPARSGCSTTLAAMIEAAAAPERMSLAFERGIGTPLPATVRLVHDRSRACTSWEAIVVGQGADVVALDDVLTGEAVGGLTSGAASGRLLLASTDWSDSFALIEFLMARPGGKSILSRRLRLIIQQRRPRLAGTPHAGATPGGTGTRVLFEPLFIGDAFRAAIGRGASIGELRALADAEGFTPLAQRVQALVSERILSEAEAARILN